MNAQIAALKAPAEIGVLESQSYALRNRPVGLDKTIATQDQISRAKIDALAFLQSKGIKKPSEAQLNDAINVELAKSGLRQLGGGLTQLPAPIDRGTI